MSDFDDYDPEEFDDDDDSYIDDQIAAFQHEYDLDNIADRVGYRDNVNDPSNIRGTVFGELYDALEYAYKIGTLSFTKFFEEGGMWFVAIPDESGQEA